MKTNVQDINKMSTEELEKVCLAAQNHIIEKFSLESQKEIVAVMELLKTWCGEFQANNVMVAINTILMMHALEKRKEEDAENSTKH